MPKFLDVHPMKGFEEQSIKKSISESPDEFGITTENALNNIEAVGFIVYLMLQIKRQLKSITRNMVSNASGLWR